MPITVKCPNCERALHVPEEASGQMVCCPVCRETFAITQVADFAAMVAVTASAPRPTANLPVPYREGPRPEQQEDADSVPVEDIALPDGFAARHRGPLILALGVMTICLFCAAPISWVLGIVTMTLANSDLMQMARHQMDSSGRGSTQTGKTLATLGMILATIWFFLFCLVRLSTFRL